MTKNHNLDKVIFTNTTLSASQLSKISFYSGIDQSSFVGDATQITASGLFQNQIIAVPEPETVITAVILLLGFTFYQIRPPATAKASSLASPSSVHAAPCSGCL